MDKSDSKSSSEDITVEVKKIWHQSPWLKILIKGAIISLPVIIMLFLISLLFNLILSLISPLSYVISPGSESPHWFFHLLSVFILLGIFYLVGLSTKNRISKYYFMFVEREYLSKVPLYTTIRDLVQQFTGLKKMPFSEVVLIDTFDSGVLMTGFVTEKVTEEIYTVFVPTAPNPTNGNIYHVPTNRLKFIDATPEEAMRTIVGMGTGSTCLFTEHQINEIEEGAAAEDEN